MTILRLTLYNVVALKRRKPWRMLELEWRRRRTGWILRNQVKNIVLYAHTYIYMYICALCIVHTWTDLEKFLGGSRFLVSPLYPPLQTYTNLQVSRRYKNKVNILFRMLLSPCIGAGSDRSRNMSAPVSLVSGQLYIKGWYGSEL